MKKFVEIRIRKTPEELRDRLKAKAEGMGLSLEAFVLVGLWRMVDGTSAGLTRDRHGTGVGQAQVSDPRHSLMRERIKKLYVEYFKLECTWDGEEAGQLSQFLRANPNVTLPQVEKMLQGYFQSEGVSPARPSRWLGELPKYAAGPVDRYGKTQTAGNFVRKAPPPVNAMDIRRKQFEEARAKGEIE